MRTLLIPIVLASAGLASAQPAPMPPSNCAVSIVRAPDGVRQTIEQALAREQCTIALQVRIIPTEGGLYLLATDDHGRVRERIVPDAASAAVLIASWAADDGLGGAAPPPGAMTAPMAPAPMGAMAPPPVPYNTPAYTGPVTAYGGNFRPPGAYEPIDGALAAPPPAYPTTYLTLTAGLGTNQSGTLRGELDFYNKNGYSLGGLISATGSTMEVSDYTYYASAYTSTIADYAFAITAGHLWRSGDWTFRGGVALGLVVSTMSLAQYDYNTGSYDSGDGSNTSPYVEASLRVGRTFGATNQWALEAGLVASYTKQDWYLADSMSTLYREAGTVDFLFGVRHGL